MKKLSINVMGKAHSFLVDDEDAPTAQEALSLMERVIGEVESDPKRPSQPEAVCIIACFRLAAELLRARAEIKRTESILKGFRALEERHGDI
ncbi:MAG: cell division protein ZapA [candidate division WOR-3 bacterium]